MAEASIQTALEGAREESALFNHDDCVHCCLRQSNNGTTWSPRPVACPPSHYPIPSHSLLCSRAFHVFFLILYFYHVSLPSFLPSPRRKPPRRSNVRAGTSPQLLFQSVAVNHP